MHMASPSVEWAFHAVGLASAREIVDLEPGFVICSSPLAATLCQPPLDCPGSVVSCAFAHTAFRSSLTTRDPLQVRTKRSWGAVSRHPDPVEFSPFDDERSEEHTSELQSLAYLVCRLLLEKKNSK